MDHRESGFEVSGLRLGVRLSAQRLIRDALQGKLSPDRKFKAAGYIGSLTSSGGYIVANLWYKKPYTDNSRIYPGFYSIHKGGCLGVYQEPFKLLNPMGC